MTINESLKRNVECFKLEAEAVDARVVLITDMQSLARAIADFCRDEGISQLPGYITGKAHWDKLPELLKGHGIETVPPGIESLNASNIGLSAADYGIAETGTAVMFEHSANELRAGNIPLTHLVVMRTSDIYARSSDLAPAIESRITSDVTAGRPIRVSFISGPSRTADIERTLTVGVHGPKRLVIFILEDER